MLVQLTVGAAALALLGPAKSSVLVSAPGSYVLHCDGFRGSVPATCQAQGSQAVLALDVNLAGSASLFFSFTLDTPEADPYPNTPLGQQEE
ncbi:unnamed protein product [Effrenium voratum]|nr:unnamed protein product [Effrenium voratum]